MNPFKNMSPTTKFVLAEALRVGVCLSAIEISRRLIITGARRVLNAY